MNINLIQVWTDTATRLYISCDGLTEKEAQEIFPQVLNKISGRSSYQKTYGMLLVSCGGEKFFVHIYKNILVELPVSPKEETVKTDKWEEVPVAYQAGGRY